MLHRPAMCSLLLVRGRQLTWRSRGGMVPCRHMRQQACNSPARISCTSHLSAESGRVQTTSGHTIRCSAHVMATNSPCNHNLAVHARQLPYRCRATPRCAVPCRVVPRCAARCWWLPPGGARACNPHSTTPRAAPWPALQPASTPSQPPPPLSSCRSYAVGILIKRDKVKRALYWDTAGASRLGAPAPLLRYACFPTLRCDGARVSVSTRPSCC